MFINFRFGNVLKNVDKYAAGFRVAFVHNGDEFYPDGRRTFACEQFVHTFKRI